MWSDTKTTSLAAGCVGHAESQQRRERHQHLDRDRGRSLHDATVNSVNRISETDMTNNTLTKTITNPTAPPTTDHHHRAADHHHRASDHDDHDGSAATKSDLIVTAVTPASTTTGTNVVPSATVKNQGTVATPAGTILDVAFVVDGDTRVVRHQDDLTGGGCVGDADRQRRRERHQLLDRDTGNHALKATVNSVNRIAETDMTNNTFITHDHQHHPCDHHHDAADDDDDSSDSGGSSAGVGVVGDRGDEQHVGQQGGWDHLRHAAVRIRWMVR